MAKEHFKTSEGHDNPHHFGYHANRMRLEASEAEMQEYSVTGIVRELTTPLLDHSPTQTLKAENEKIVTPRVG
jgi:hypothetical protein